MKQTLSLWTLGSVKPNHFFAFSAKTVASITVGAVGCLPAPLGCRHRCIRKRSNRKKVIPDLSFGHDIVKKNFLNKMDQIIPEKSSFILSSDASNEYSQLNVSNIPQLTLRILHRLTMQWKNFVIHYSYALNTPAAKGSNSFITQILLKEVEGLQKSN